MFQGSYTIIQAMSNIYAFATDTVYGLGASCYDPEAIDALYRLKERSASQPMQVLVADRAMAETLVHVAPHQPIDAKTRIYPARIGTAIDPRLIADDGIGVRLPNHQALQDYIHHLGVPIAASSANLRGKPALCDAEAVQVVFPDIPIVVAGDCSGGSGSEVWDMRTQPAQQLR